MSTNTSQEAFKDLWNAHYEVLGQVADVAKQVQRLQRMANIDEKERRLEKINRENAVITAVEEMTGQVAALVGQAQRATPDLEGDKFFHQEKEARRVEVEKSLEYIRYLTTLKRSSTDRCPCGKHKGLRLSDEKGNVIEENLCPISWWVKQGRLAFAEGRLEEYNRTNPLSMYLKYFEVHQVKP